MAAAVTAMAKATAVVAAMETAMAVIVTGMGVVAAMATAAVAGNDNWLGWRQQQRQWRQ